MKFSKSLKIINFEQKKIMVLVLKGGTPKQQIKAIDKKLYNNKMPSGFVANKHKGKLSLNIDPLQIQKKLRDEWNGDLS